MYAASALASVLGGIGGPSINGTTCVIEQDQYLSRNYGESAAHGGMYWVDPRSFGADVVMDVSPEFVWGVFTRAYGIMLVIIFGVFLPQVGPWAGSRGASPIRDIFRRAIKDLPSTWHAFLNAPSVFWVNSSDLMLHLVPTVGALAGAHVAIIGGPASPAMLFVAWVCLLSMDVPMGLTFPWDTLALEATFLTMWLPPLRGDSIAAAALPHPLVSFLLRMLLWRLMIGFGKLKFIGTTPRDKLYIKNFFIGMPMANFLGWFAYNTLPFPAHVFNLFVMFVVELPVPFLAFFVGWPRVLAGIALIALQLGIHATGNFGYFNVLTAVLSIPLFDWRDSVTMRWSECVAGASPEATGLLPLEGAWESLASSQEEGVLSLANQVIAHGRSWSILLLLAIALCIILPSFLVLFILNSWVTLSAMHWPSLETWPAFMRGLRSWIRFWQPFRIVHAYGVFPPHANPASRYIVVFEGAREDEAPGLPSSHLGMGMGSEDEDEDEAGSEPRGDSTRAFHLDALQEDCGMTWRPFHYRFMATDERSTPPFVAPIHPRLDQAIFYDPLGNNGSDVLSVGGNMGTYGPSNSSVWARLQARLCMGAAEPVNRLFAKVPFPDPTTPPDWVRASLYYMRPTTLLEWTRTSKYWHRERMGTHMPAVHRSPDTEAHESTARHLLASHRLGGPEVWGPENLTWILDGSVTRSGHSVDEEDLEALWSFVAFAREMVRLGARRAGGYYAVVDGSEAMKRGRNGGSKEEEEDDDEEEGMDVFAASCFPPDQFEDPMDDGAWLDGDSEEAAIEDVHAWESREMAEEVDRRAELHAASKRAGGRYMDSEGDATSGADLPMDVEEARRLLQWRSLPFLYRRMLVRYTAGQLRRLQTVMGAVVGPVAAGVRSLVCRPAPSADTIRADLTQLAEALEAIPKSG